MRRLLLAIALVELSASMAVCLACAQAPPPAPAPASPCKAGEIAWTQPPVNAPACSCRDLKALQAALESARRFRSLYQSIANTLGPLEQGGLSVAESNKAFKAFENDGSAVIQNSQGATGEIAWTWNPTCVTCIPVQNLTAYCQDILDDAWTHEASHRQTCQREVQNGLNGNTVHGSVNAIDERDAYAATIPLLRDAVLRLLKNARLTWKGDTNTTLATGQQEGKSTGQVTLVLSPRPNVPDDLFFDVSGTGTRVDSVSISGSWAICHHRGGPTTQPEKITAFTDLDQLTLIQLSTPPHEIPVTSDNCSHIKKWPIEGPGDSIGGLDDIPFRDGEVKTYSGKGSQNDRNGTYTLELCPSTPANVL